MEKQDLTSLIGESELGVRNAFLNGSSGYPGNVLLFAGKRCIINVFFGEGAKLNANMTSRRCWDMPFVTSTAHRHTFRSNPFGESYP